MKKPMTILATGLLAASTAVLSACGAGGGASGGGGDVVRLATGVDPSYSAVYVAEDQGFFKKQGVDVQVSNLEGGPAMAQAVIAGQADMGTQSDGTSVTQMASDPKLTALMDFQHSGTYIKVVWGPKVKAAGDIKKLATLPGIMTLATVRYLESQHVDPKSVQQVTGTPPDVPVMLKRGDVDATVIYEPWATRAASEAKGKIAGTIGDFGVSYSQWLITNSTWLKGHEDQAAKVARALDEANQFMVKNPEKTQQIVSKAIKMPADQVAQIMKDLVLQTRDLDAATLATEKKTAQFFVDNGTLKSAPDLDKQVQVGWWAKHKG
jgi:NitT/TauT family transport system substrate-binding protein